MSYIPMILKVRTGGVEPPQPWLHELRATGLQPAELAVAQRPHGGGRPDSNRYHEVHNLECCRYTTATTEAGTTGLEPAASRLTSECSAQLSYAPE